VNRTNAASFYQSIAEWYDWIFPLDLSQVEFVRRHVRIPVNATKILDAGCGTGSLAVALAEAKFDVTGIDADSKMIRLAKVKAGSSPNVRFEVMDMRDMIGHFGSSAFGCALCFGNTLVHLTKMDGIFAFIRQIRILLKDGGLFLLQILNYDHILDKDITKLPLIENERIRFERIYRFDETSGLMRFRTVLTVKSENRSIENEASLLPIRKEELEAVLVKSGFHAVQWYGDFSGNPFTEESLPLVAAASE
jgi:glycine/sarcosine N-methyltransferase